jgi:hypothetical protein
MKHEFCHQTFEKYSDMKLHKHSYSGRQVAFHGDGQMNMTKLKSHFSQFCDAPKNVYVEKLAETIFVGKSAFCGCVPPEIQALFTCT